MSALTESSHKGHFCMRAVSIDEGLFWGFIRLFGGYIGLFCGIFVGTYGKLSQGHFCIRAVSIIKGCFEYLYGFFAGPLLAHIESPHKDTFAFVPCLQIQGPFEDL